MLVGFDELHIRAGSPIQNGCKVHLEPPVVGGKAPRGQIVLPLPRHGNVEGHLPQLVGPAAVKQHILAGGRGISEAIADVPAEGNAIHLPGGAAPVPCVVICPHAPSPVQHAEGVGGVKGVCLPPDTHRPGSPHTVDLLVVVEVAGLVKGRADDHGLLRLLRQQQVALDGVPVQEVLHAEGQLPAAGDMAEHQRMALATAGGVSGGGGLRQAGAAHREHAHGAFRLFPPLVKVQERDGVQPHVAVVGNGQRHGEMVVGRQIVIPFLDAGLPGPDVGAAVDGQDPLGVARLPQAALVIEQRCAVGDLMLHAGILPYLFFGKRGKTRRQAYLPSWVTALPLYHTRREKDS